jgi:sigma-54-interacting transcriptional regulator
MRMSMHRQPGSASRDSPRVFLFPLPEAHVLSGSRANVLLRGSSLALHLAITALLDRTAEPVVRWRGASTDDGFSDQPFTLLVESVDRLPRDAQDTLFVWIGEHDRCVRVISTSEKRLYSLVERGVFSASLFYRLNTISITVDARRSTSVAAADAD